MSRTWCDRLMFGVATMVIEFIVGDPTSACADVVRDEYRSIQVNVDVHGQNMLGDAANEPSIDVDPSAPQRMAIGFRQFDSVQSSLRQAGWAYSRDGGHHWVFPGSLAPGVAGSDPVLDVTADGVFYYLSINPLELRLFRSLNGGASWDDPIWVERRFADKPWLAIDRTTGPGAGHLYIAWDNVLRRSTNGGFSFGELIQLPAGIGRGTLTVDPYGTVFPARSRSTNAQFAEQQPAFDPLFFPPFQMIGYGNNGSGLVAQEWIVADHGPGPSRGHLYFMTLMEGVRGAQYSRIGVSRSEYGDAPKQGGPPSFPGFDRTTRGSFFRFL